MPGRLREFDFLDWHQFLISAISKTEIGGWWEVHFGGQTRDFIVFGRFAGPFCHGLSGF